MNQVSVIIPAYNGDRYIEEAIVSILHQTYTDWEIIIVDDGSTDSTSNIVRKYGDRVKYFHQTNQGVAASRNLGLSKAEGEYIAFLDQDDVFLSHKLATQVTVLAENPNLGMVNSGWEIVDRDGKVQAAVEPWQQIPQLSMKDLIVWKPVFLGAMLFRKSWLQRTSGFDISLEQTPDVDLVLNLAAIGCTAAWVKQTTVKYRQHESNASRNSLLQAQELESILARFFSQPNLAPQIKKLEADSRYQSLVWSAWRLLQIGCDRQAIDYLHKSQDFSQKYPTEMIIDWIESFKKYSAEYGTNLDIIKLTNSSQWQALVKKFLT